MDNDWITRGIKCCVNLRSLYTFSRNIYDPKLKAFNVMSCKILIKPLKEVKTQHYNRFIPISIKKTEATWNNVKRPETYV
jgi:hypothetical protein